LCDTPKRGSVNRLVAILLAASMMASGAEVDSTAMRDAKTLASCIKASDVECIVSFSYRDKATIENPNGKADLIKDIHGRYGHAESGPPLVDFILGGPSPEFSGDGKKFVFIPYSKQYWSPSVSALHPGFLIGVSIDDGTTWTFVDNWRATEEAVLLVYPGYVGQPKIPEVGGPTWAHAPPVMRR
jgi:hypothetical protein